MANAATEGNQVRPKIKKLLHDDSNDDAGSGSNPADSPARNGAAHRRAPPQRGISCDGESQSAAEDAVSGPIHSTFIVHVYFPI